MGRSAVVFVLAGKIADSELTDIMVDMELGELLKDWIHDWSDDENSDHGDWAENGNVGDDDIEENNSEVSNEDYISQLISGSHNAYDYYGESDAETDLEDETVDAHDSEESQSSVNMSEVTEDEGKENVQASTHVDDQRDMLMKIREMTFVSAEAAFNVYNIYAKDNGFSIRKDKVRYSKTESHHMRLRRYVCSREGKRDSRLLTEKGRSRRLRPKSCCNCEAQLTVKLDKKRGVWCVGSFEDKHSHMLGRPDEYYEDFGDVVVFDNTYKRNRYANFYMLQDDLRKVGSMEIVERMVGDEAQQFIVCWKNNR
ncbi:uncharacterized protein LOC123442296 [Hordeum vulgare subsp. vulgare]|uniref:uncharacterized protein LOC123442296 n=1 Tax=Hordeum vulgare subsp. vulgare TaxID=112509 RepID=UPI001D1A3356|nr:uncharacterized protein LOC123442296 [Hordeum vulgare subsp. vulgare]